MADQPDLPAPHDLPTEPDPYDLARPPAGFDEAPALPFPAAVPAATPVPPAAVPTGRAGRRARRPLLWGGAVVLALALGYVGAALATAGRVPGGTTVAGLPVGGLSRQAAVAAVTRAQQDPAVPVAIGDRRTSLDAADAGLVVDPQAVIGEVTGFSLAPDRLWRHVGGGPRLEAGRQAGDRLVGALRAVAQDLDVPAADAGVRFDGTTPVLTPSTAGRSLDVPAAAAALRRGWLGAEGPVPLPVRTTAATIDDAQAKAALEQLVTPALASPLTVQVGSRQVRLAPEALAPSLRLVAAEGRLALAVDGKTLAKTVLAQDRGIETKAQDARIVLKDGRPAIEPDVPGRALDAARLGDAALAVLRGPDGARVVQAPTIDSPAAFTAAEAAALGVKEKVSTFATNLTDNPLRTENLTVAARTVNGTLVLPGETFSLNGVLGERTTAKGYNEAPAISGGRLVRDVGGGVSQMATTIFNNVFFAGLEDVYHKPHSFYISRYPEGREATVNWPTVDLKWRNDSPSAVLIQASVSGGQVRVSFWSTKRWEITSQTSGRSNYRTPTTVYDPSPGCVPQDANSGFDVTVTRLFYKPGSTALVKKQSWSTTYIAEDKVVCGPKPAG